MNTQQLEAAELLSKRNKPAAKGILKARKASLRPLDLTENGIRKLPAKPILPEVVRRIGMAMVLGALLGMLLGGAWLLS